MKDETTMLVFGFVALAFMGFLAWKIFTSSKTTVTSFTRDGQGRITEILEKELK